MPIWLREDAVRAMHQRQLAEHGGQPGIRDENLLLSALARPQHLHAYAEVEPDISALAAAYAFGIARNHPFLDGNKRTALVASRTFLLLNGSNLLASAENKYRTFLALAAGEIDEAELSRWFAANVQPLD